MNQSLGLVAIVVLDYDEALGFYIGTLGFRLIDDTPVPAQQKRWVIVAPPGSTSSHLLLARAVADAQSARIGNQTGDRVFLFRTPITSGAIFVHTSTKASSSFGVDFRS